jgi:hypothetical protein
MYIVRRMTDQELHDLLLQIWAEEAQGKPAPEAGEAVPEAAPPADQPAAEGAGAAPPQGAKKPATPLEELQTLAEGGVPQVKPTEAPAPKAPETPAPKTAPQPQVAPQAPVPQTANEPVWDEEKQMWVYKPRPAGEAGKTEGATVPEKATEAAQPPEGQEQLSPEVRNRLQRMGVVQGGGGELKRIIRVNVPALKAGDPTQNVIMRNGDQLSILEPPAGEWYIDGEVARRGVYSLTGRKITLLQAIAAAGGLTQLAIPKRTELVRRVSEDAEEIIYVDLGLIARGEAPDFFLQPNDVIRVGTDQGAIFLAVLRNAFRATYGFGLVYDQNFADIYPWKGGIHPLFGN